MSWSYSDPSGSREDAVRFMIGDTTEADPLLQDEEITFVLANEGTNYAAAAVCCESISAKFARMPDKKLGPSQISNSQKSMAYANKATYYWAQAGKRGMPTATGLSQQEITTNSANPDLVQPKFSRGMMTSD